MNESYRLGEQSIVAYLQRLANGVSTAELDVDALPTELRAGAKDARHSASGARAA